MDQDQAGVEALVLRLQAMSPQCIVMEATGGYEAPIAAALGAAGLPVAVVNPRQVRDFAGPRGSWPRLTAWTPPLSPTSGRPARSPGRRCAPRKPAHSRDSSPGGGNSSGCGLRSTCGANGPCRWSERGSRK